MLGDRVSHQIAVPEENFPFRGSDEYRYAFPDRYPTHQTTDGRYKGYRVSVLVAPDLTSPKSGMG
jgi:hypothetical protein